MSDGVLTEKRVRGLYAHATVWKFYDDVAPEVLSMRETMLAEFDRFIAKIKADAWDEGVKAQCVAYDMRPDAGTNPYREQGDSNEQ